MDEGPGRLERFAGSPLLNFVLSTAPWTGGISYLLSDYAQGRRVARIERFLEGLEQRVEELGSERVDAAAVNSDEFFSSFEWAVEIAAKTGDEAKLAFVRDFLVSSALTIRPDVSVQRIFASYVDRLAGSHMLVLVEFARLQADVSASDRLGRTRLKGKVPIAAEDVSVVFDPPLPSLTTAICVDLCGIGLLVDWADLARSGRRQREFCLTESGRLFARFITSSWVPDRT